MVITTSRLGLDTGTGQSAGALLVPMTSSIGGGGTGGTARLQPSTSIITISIITTAAVAIVGAVSAVDGVTAVRTWQNWEPISTFAGRLSQCPRTGSGDR